MQITRSVKRIALALLALGLVSCDQGPGGRTGADDYKFETKEYQKQTITVTIQVFQSQTELDHYARDNNIRVSGLAAFSKLYPSVDKCTIFVVDPTVNYEPEFLGHEFAHCVWGRWHPKRDQAEFAAGNRNIK